jgi:hypothetical protein
MYGNNEDVPKRFFDNSYPESHLRDVTFAVVWNVVAKRFFDNFYPESHLRYVTFAAVWNDVVADENKSVN